MPPILDVLRNVDPTFVAIPDTLDQVRVARFRTTSQNYLVEFLTPNRGSDDHMGKPAAMPALAWWSFGDTIALYGFPDP